MTETVLIAIIGVAGTLLGSCLGLLGNSILEKSKVKNDRKLYMSKAQYDLELTIYRNISKQLFGLIVELTTIYSDDHYKQQNEEKDRESESKTYIKLVGNIADVQDTLYENAPFIPEHIYEKYDEIYQLAKEQFWDYQRDVKEFVESGIKPTITKESRDRVDKIESLYKSVNDELRKYLSSISLFD